MTRKFLIVGLDGLRPDLVRPDLTPNLARLREEGAVLGRHRSIFPSESFPAWVSITTGCQPSEHGIVANDFWDPALMPQDVLAAGRPENVDLTIDRPLGAKPAANPVIQVPGLAEILAQHGLTMAVISGSLGGSRLWNPNPQKLGSFVLCCESPETSVPQQQITRVINKLGSPPPRRAPDCDRLTYQTRVFLEYVWPELTPDITLLWFDEPDESSHKFGVYAHNTLDALRLADEKVGLLMDWQRAQEDCQLIVLSDHGHVQQAADRTIDVLQSLQSAGFKVSSAPSDYGDILLLPGHVGQIYIRNHSRVSLSSIVKHLAEQPWCGSMLAKGPNGPDGCLPASYLKANHARSADLIYTLNSFGQGATETRCWHEAATGKPAGYHGGLHPFEMSCIGIFLGNAFRRNHTSDLYSGLTDIAPTILAALAIRVPDSMTGRILHEVISTDETSPPGSPEVFLHSAALGDYRQFLRTASVDGTFYVDCGWRDLP